MTGPSPIRLALADDHPLVMDALDNLFRDDPGVRVVARCTSGDAILDSVEQHRPDVLLFDKHMPGRNTFQVVTELQTLAYSPRCILLTAHLTDDEMLEAMRIGVRGILLKTMPSRLFVDCVRKVAAGEQWLEKESVGRAMDRLLRREQAEAELRRILTTRELEIVRMVAIGLRNKEIAERTFISEGTVRTHLYNIFQKLNVANRLELSELARRHGLVRSGSRGESPYDTAHTGSDT